MKRILPVILIFVLLLIIKNNISYILGFLRSGSALNALEKSYTVEEKKNKYLKERLKYVKTDGFIEEEAQEKLGMLREGEYFVIAPTATPQKIIDLELDTKPNWKKWLELFF